MALRESPFPNCFAEGLHAVGWGLILPCFWSLDRLIALSMSTSLERSQRAEQECYLHPLKVFFGSVLFLTLFLATAPLAFLGFLLWAPLQVTRRPFSYHQEPPSRLASEPAGDGNRGFGLGGAKATFGFVTANLCLLPDGIARFNNLGHTQRRATAIGRSIVQGVNRPHIRIFVDSPSSCGTLSPSSSLLPGPATATSPASYGATAAKDREPQHPPPVTDHSDRAAGEAPAEPAEPNGPDHVVHVTCDDTEECRQSTPAPPVVHANQNSNERGHTSHRNPPRALHTQGVLATTGDIPWEVSSLFPANVDILCLEEVFDKRAAWKLTDALRPLFPHILYDVGVYACQPPGSCSSFKFFNSGLFLASRHPVLEAQYRCFPNGRGEDALAAKGLLSAKVLVGQSHRQKNVVGYINCTHLHAPKGEGEIRCEQLNMVTKWIQEFQEVNGKPDEVVAFDVLCGDFNFDNCSPDDVLEQKHSLFEEYTDPCRAGPGQEHPWVIGTLLEQPTLYREDVKTPENLQRTLETEELRMKYISPPVALEGCPMVYPELGQSWVGRRIDYILFRESTVAKHCRTEIEEYTFVTQLAGLTDHIPVGLRLNVTLEPETAQSNE
ncbi:sphingomyelin phosphodiesterase 5 [Esox lucius]|uniref:sphingomyelin phosphodiesterase n=1 Tax=Esox lucius TaxID=8010 RepID=A0A3P8XA88_ESOLU|nr:sphingomyelin phosphodiesterase 5 [Esox lucius]XP_010882767.1 sphingomyelin phosphodiesterase 5 [Esox lucius]XP_034144554.1 sphingomyelin phosphodiesterase 5 [Esox lucius]